MNHILSLRIDMYRIVENLNVFVPGVSSSVRRGVCKRVAAVLRRGSSAVLPHSEGARGVPAAGAGTRGGRGRGWGERRRHDTRGGYGYVVLCISGNYH